MKYTILQISKSLICLTPVSVDKARSSQAGGRGFLGGLLGGGNRSKATFGGTKLFSLPDSLYGNAMEKPKELVEFIIDCAQQSDIELKEVIFCPEGDELITKEYQHMVAKKKYLNSFAVLETEPMVDDDVVNYSVISCEYGEEYGKSNQSDMLNAVLYAMKNSTMNGFKDALQEKEIKLVRITPPTIALINAAKYDINSVEKTIALLSVDYVGVRLVVVNHGAPIYSQYFTSPVIDIAEVFGRDQGMGTAESVNMIKTLGMGAANKCFPQTAGKIKDQLETFVSEIVRNLRMVLMSQRLQLDHMYVSDSLESMKGLDEYISDYVANSGISEHVSSIKDVLTPQNVPNLDSTAQDAGYDSASYYLFNNMITYCDGIDDNMLFGIGTVKKRNVNIGKYVCYAAIAALAVYMGIFGALSAMMHLRRSSDNKQLDDVKYNNVKKLLDEREILSIQINNANTDKDLLPKGSYAFSIIDKTIDVITSNGGEASSYNFNLAQNRIDINFKIASYNKFTELKNAIENNPEFIVLIPFTATIEKTTGAYNCSVRLSINMEKYKFPEKENEKYLNGESSSEAESDSSAADNGSISSEAAVSSDVSVSSENVDEASSYSGENNDEVSSEENNEENNEEDYEEYNGETDEGGYE